MFGLGVMEVVCIGAVIGLMFGPSQIPKIGKSLGDSIIAFKRAKIDVLKFEAEAEKEIKLLENSIDKEIKNS